jgi:hypothetical protein
MNGFAVASLDDDTGETSLCEICGMPFDRGNVNIFVLGEEGDGRHVNARDEGSVSHGLDDRNNC